jgi:hypothetical protein
VQVEKSAPTSAASPPDFSDYPSIRLPGPRTSLTLAQMESALRQYGALAARPLLARVAFPAAVSA